MDFCRFFEITDHHKNVCQISFCYEFIPGHYDCWPDYKAMGWPIVKTWLTCEIHWKMDRKKTIAIIFQQQLLMHSQLFFWLNSCQVTARNTAKKSCVCHSNGQNCTDMCGCGEFCQNTDPPLSRKYLKRISNFKRNLVNIQ